MTSTLHVKLTILVCIALLSSLLFYQCREDLDDVKSPPQMDLTFEQAVKEYIAELQQTQSEPNEGMQFRSSNSDCRPEEDPGCGEGYGQRAEVYMAEYDCFAVVEYDFLICWNLTDGATYDIFNVQIYPSATSCAKLLDRWDTLYQDSLLDQLRAEIDSFERTLEENYLHLVFEDGLNYLLQFMNCNEGGQTVLGNYWNKLCTRKCMYFGEISIEPNPTPPPSILTFSCGNLCCVTSQLMCWNGDQLEAISDSETRTLYGTGDCDGEPVGEIRDCGENYVAIGDCGSAPCEE